MATKKVKYPYYNIPIPMFPVNIKLCFNEDDFRQILKDHNIGQKITALDSGIAESHYITDGKSSLIVAIFNLEECKSPTEEFFLAATVCHESVHLCQRVFDSIGEEDIGEEVQAYVTEYIFTQIMKGIQQYEGSGKRNRKVPDSLNQKVLGALLQMAELSNGGTGQDSNPKPKDIFSGTQNIDGQTVPEASRRVRRSR
jgi:hypothetical protein